MRKKQHLHLMIPLRDALQRKIHSQHAIIQGKSEIRNYYSDPYFESASVTWSPDFVEASFNGDMGYTYGKYLWQSKDSTGKEQNYKGVFHTVWKKQEDGSWKYVWD